MQDFSESEKNQKGVIPFVYPVGIGDFQLILRNLFKG